MTPMQNPINSMQPEASPRRARGIERFLVTVVAGGAAIAAIAILWPTQENLRIAGPAPRTEVVPAMAPAPASPPAVVVVAEETRTSTIEAAVEVPDETVEGKRPLVALVTEDEDTDYEAEALGQLERGDLREAFDSLRRHLYRHEPSAELLLRVGRIGRQIGEHAVAEQALLDAAALAPKDAEVQVELGRVHLDGNDLPAARMAARQAIRLDRESAPAWNLAGRVAMEGSEWRRAEQAFRRAVELEPTAAMIHNNLGLLYVHMKRGEDAVDSLETAVELLGEDAPAYVLNNLGLAYELNGQLEDAHDAYSEAALTNPDYARAQVNQDRVAAAIEAKLKDPS